MYVYLSGHVDAKKTLLGTGMSAGSQRSKVSAVNLHVCCLQSVCALCTKHVWVPQLFKLIGAE